jgi:DNA-binding NtrC family response regulator
MPKLLIVDDEQSIRQTLRDILEYENFEVEEAADGKEGLQKILNNEYDVVILDIKMPKMDGMEVMEEVSKVGVDVPIIMLSGHGNIDTAVEAVKKGAYDYISKPPDLNRLLITIRNAMEKSTLVTETKVLKKKVSKTRDIIGESDTIRKIKETIEKVAPTEARVLVTGDNGSGKELVARWIHEKSNRANGPLIEVNCAAIPAELIESELFGHEKGAFTSAIKQRIGKFEQANGGTLFLDEIGDMSLSAQAKVLRALQENKITRVGGEKEIKVDVRIVAATNKDLMKEVEENKFRLDLYHRLGVILIHVPSLNERLDDIPLLSDFFLEEICDEYGVPKKNLENDAIKALQNRNWTGNIRELRNLMERLVIMSDKVITKQDVLAYCGVGGNTVVAAISNNNDISPDYSNFSSFQQYKDYMEKCYIEFKLEENGWNVTQTADELDMQRSNLYQKMEKFGLKKK